MADTQRYFGGERSTITLPMLAGLALGAFVVYKLFLQRIVEVEIEDKDEPVPDPEVEFVTSDSPKCQNMEDKLKTPAGCGIVKVLAYRRKGYRVRGHIREEVYIEEIPGYPGYYLQKSPTDAHAAFIRMMAGAKADGVIFSVNSAFRTMAKQKELYKLYKSGRGNEAAIPGRSTHQYGVTLDIAVKTRPKTLQWLRSNASNYGFFETVKGEPHHWEYISAKDPKRGK